jgi:valyl-tRNA synthetase
LAKFYPGDVLATAPEILFFWVARMIMAGLEFQGQVPFTTVYLHGTVRDTQHRKMSKSLGNGIDPLEVVDRYGADALRYTVVSGMAVGTDLILDPDDLDKSFAVGRNFANKLWNIGRFVLGNIPEAVRPLTGTRPDAITQEELTLADRWIVARCEETVVTATRAYEQFRLNEAATTIYHFIWSDLADWYLEQIKPRLFGNAPGGDVARAVVAQTFDVALRLLHPVTPFITETLWRRFPGRPDDASIGVAPWPQSDRRAVDAEATTAFGMVQELVSAVRAVRAEYGITPGRAVSIWVSRSHHAFKEEATTIQRLAKVDALNFGEHPKEPGGHAVLTDGTGVFIPLGNAVDLERECGRLGSEHDRLEQLIAGQKRKLDNEKFLTRAPGEVVETERKKLASWQDQATALGQKRQLLGCL